jgi:hypothetical protein
MKYATEMGSAAMIYMPNFINICSCIQKFIGKYTYRHTRTHTDIKVIP